MAGLSLARGDKPARNLFNLVRSGRAAPQSRSFQELSFDQYLELFQFGGQTFPFTGSTLQQKAQEAPDSFRAAVEMAYRGNGVVFATMLVRMLLFSEARFQWRRMIGGRPGNLFGDQSLKLLERPWPNGTTGDLLTRMIMDADLEGNFFAARAPGPQQPSLQRMPPDWVTIVMGSKSQPTTPHPNWERDAEIIGYLYHPGGRGSGVDPEPLLVDQVCHFAPIPDPTARFRGMSWLTPVVREIMGDNSAMIHKQKFFENGATPNLVVSLNPDIAPENFQKWVDIFEGNHVGALNAYKTLYLGGGADTSVIGKDMQQIDFKQVQGHGETRIAAAGGVPPIIVGLSEGLESATYSNFGQARRRLADATLRPLWRNAAGSLDRIIDRPTGAAGAELWYDDRDIPFLQEDVKDAAEILQVQATTSRQLIEAGFEPDEVIGAVAAGDLARLIGKHTGLLTVQLQPPGSAPAVPPVVNPPAPTAPTPPANGAVAPKK